MSLTLASLNLHCGLDHNGLPYPVTPAIAALDTDIVVVQENWRPDGERSLARQAATDCGYQAYAEINVITGRSLAELGVAGNAPGTETGAWGLAIMSRVPWRGLSAMSLGAARGDVVGARRALIADLPVGQDGGLLRVVDVHLTHRLAHGPAQLGRLLAALDSTVPTVIAGDLNMCRPTVYLAGPYRPVVRGRTWPAYRPIAQIDHVLAGPGVMARNAGVAAGVGSDHLPVRVELEVRGAGMVRARENAAAGHLT